MVYVLNKNGIPLMPTKRHGKVRKMLKNGHAKVVKRCKERKINSYLKKLKALGWKAPEDMTPVSV